MRSAQRGVLVWRCNAGRLGIFLERAHEYGMISPMMYTYTSILNRVVWDCPLSLRLLFLSIKNA